MFQLLEIARLKKEVSDIYNAEVEDEFISRDCGTIYESFSKAATYIIRELPYRKFDEPALRDTPSRFAKFMMERLQGEFVTNEQVAKLYGKVFPYEGSGEMVLVKDIECFSMCEHHIALMYNMKVSIAYIPKNNILGLSKFARIVDIISKRLQTQEKMGKDIMEVLETVLPQVPILVQIKAEHSCMTARGIQKPGTQTVTLHTNDLVSEEIKKEFFNLLEEKK